MSLVSRLGPSEIRGIGATDPSKRGFLVMRENSAAPLDLDLHYTTGFFSSAPSEEFFLKNRGQLYRVSIPDIVDCLPTVIHLNLGG